MSLATTFFSDPKQLTNLIFPYLNGKELATVQLVNKASQKASRVDLLWENLYTFLGSFNHYPFEKSWRDQYIVTSNWHQGIYREGPVRRFNANNTILECSHVVSPRVVSVDNTGFKILFLTTNTEVFIKAADFHLERKKFLKDFMSTKMYTGIKTNTEILIYKNSTGELFRAIPLTNPDWRYQSFAFHKDLLASVDNSGRMFRLWNLENGELLWETKLEDSDIQRRVNRFYFSHHQLIYLSTTTPNAKDRWCINYGTKTILKNPSIEIFYPEPRIAKKQAFLTHRINNAVVYIEKVGRNDPQFLSQLINTLAPRINPDPSRYRIRNYGPLVCDDYFQQLTSFWINFEKRTLLQGGAMSILRIGRMDTFETIFLKKIENLWINKVVFHPSKLFISGIKPYTNEMQVLTYDFHPSSKPIRHPRTLEAPLSLWQRFLQIVKRFFNFIQQPIIYAKQALNRAWRLIRR